MTIDADHDRHIYGNGSCPISPPAPSPSSSPISRAAPRSGSGTGRRWRQPSSATSPCSSGHPGPWRHPLQDRRRCGAGRLSDRSRKPWPPHSLGSAPCWPRTGARSGPLRVRMALHAGEAIPDARGDYLAAPLNRLSRLLSTGHGGQILLSQTVQQLTRGALPQRSSCGISASTGCAICWSRSGSSSCCTPTCRPSSRRSSRWRPGPTTCPCSRRPSSVGSRRWQRSSRLLRRPEVQLLT